MKLALPVDTKTARQKGLHDREPNYIYLRVPGCNKLTGYYSLCDMSRKQFGALLLIADKAIYGNVEYGQHLFSQLPSRIRFLASKNVFRQTLYLV